MGRERSLRMIICAMVLGMAGAAHAQQPVKWEYKVVDITCAPNQSCATVINAKLTEMGNDGWELVHVLRDMDAAAVPVVSNRLTAVFKKSNMATVIADYKKNAETAQQAINDLKKSTLDAITSGLAPAIKADAATVAAIADQIEVTRLTQIEQRLRALEDRRR
jgi:hypothetical protein